MTVPVDSAFCYAAGHLFALAGSDAMEEDPGREGECLWRGRLFTALAVVPVGLLFLARWPEWSWMYCAGRRSRSRLLGALDRLIAKKRDLKQAAMQQLLTPPRAGQAGQTPRPGSGQARLPGFDGEWVVKRLGEVVQIQKGQLITSKTLRLGEIPVIAGGKQPAYFHAAANRKGCTITISASGASAGYVARHDQPIFASDCSTISESEDYSLDFIFYQLLNQQHTIYRAQTGGAQPHIHTKDLNPLSIPVPPLPEQTAIAEVLSEMDAELAGLEQRREKTRALKQGMMQELLTGRVRLVGGGLS